MASYLSKVLNFFTNWWSDLLFLLERSRQHVLSHSGWTRDTNQQQRLLDECMMNTNRLGALCLSPCWILCHVVLHVLTFFPLFFLPFDKRKKGHNVVLTRSGISLAEIKFGLAEIKFARPLAGCGPVSSAPPPPHIRILEASALNKISKHHYGNYRDGCTCRMLS